MKKILALLLAAAVTLGLAACAGEAPAETHSSTAVQSSTTAESTDLTGDTESTAAPEPTETVITEPAATETATAAQAPTGASTTAPTQAPTTAPTQAPTTTQAPSTAPSETQHIHSYSEAVTAASCTEKGYTAYTCSCGHSYIGSETAAKGHSWSEWVTTKSPTLEAEGTAERTCSACSAKEAQALDKLIYTPPTATVTKTAHQATSLSNSDGYAVVVMEGDIVNDPELYCSSSYILDKTGKMVFGPVDYWIHSLRYDSGIVLMDKSTTWGDLWTPYYLDGTPVPLDDLLPSEEMDAFFAKHEGNQAYSRVEKDTYYQVESLYNGWMTLWRRCVVNCYEAEQRVAGDTLVQSFVLSTDGKHCMELPDIFNIEHGAGSGGYVYIGEVGGYSEEGLMWFWHWDLLKGSIYNLKESSFTYQASWDDPDHLWPAGYMDLQGNIVIPAQYKTVWAFSEGLAAVGTADGKVGFIDPAGQAVIPFDYTDAVSFCSGYAAVQKEGKWGYIDKDGDTVLPFVYDDAFGAGEGLMAVGQAGKYGLVDAMGNVIVPLEYDDISIVENGVAYAIRDGYVYVIDIQ